MLYRDHPPSIPTPVGKAGLKHREGKGEGSLHPCCILSIGWGCWSCFCLDICSNKIHIFSTAKVCFMVLDFFPLALSVTAWHLVYTSLFPINHWLGCLVSQRKIPLFDRSISSLDCFTTGSPGGPLGFLIVILWGKSKFSLHCKSFRWIDINKYLTNENRVFL